MSPKQLFQLDKPRVTAHNEMVGSPLFTANVGVALLQMQRDLLGWNMDESKAKERFHMLSGAQYFVSVLSGLGKEQETPSPQGLPPNLNH